MRRSSWTPSIVQRDDDHDTMVLDEPCMTFPASPSQTPYCSHVYYSDIHVGTIAVRPSVDGHLRLGLRILSGHAFVAALTGGCRYWCP